MPAYPGGYSNSDTGPTNFISPEGLLRHYLAYLQLKELFDNTNLSVPDAYYLLHKQKMNQSFKIRMQV